MLFYILLVVTSIQLIYWLGIFSKFIYYKQLHSNVVRKSFSVIVAANNECQNLKRLIPMLLEQVYYNFELIIIDDRSTDGTQEYMEKMSKINSLLKYIQITKTTSGFNSKKYAIMEAIKMAKFDYLLFTDADCYPKSIYWIDEINKAYYCENIEVVLGFSPYERKSGFLNKLICFETLMTALQYFSMALIGHAYMGIGRNLSYKKEIFIKNKGFENFENIVGGDDDLFVSKVSKKNNLSIVISQDSQMISLPKTKWIDWIKQKNRHLSVGHLYKFKTKLLLFLFHFSNFLHYLFLFLLIIIDGFSSSVIIIYLVRIFAGVYITYKCSKKLKQQCNILSFPILDLVYIIYLTLVSFYSYFNKTSQWNQHHIFQKML